MWSLCIDLRRTRKEKPARRTRKEKPARRTRKEKPARRTRKEKPARRTRKEKPARRTRKEKPARRTRKEKPAKQTKNNKKNLQRGGGCGGGAAEVALLFASHWKQQPIEHLKQLIFCVLRGKTSCLQLLALQLPA